MKLVAKLAISQIKTKRNRSIMTLLGITLSTSMLTAVCGFVSSAKQTVYMALGMDGSAPVHFTLILMGAILGAIVMSASIIVVSNAFRVSAGERTRQFGILKSVGATKNQIAETVLYEGVFLSAIGIPIGIALGLFIDLVGVSIITKLLHSLSEGGTLNVDNEAILTVPFSAPPIMFVIAIMTSFITVLLSAWLPAQKAAKLPAIEAIRSVGEVKLKRKSYRTSRITQILFGFEGTLAAKSLLRSRRNFRATVISLTISIILLISAGSFGSLMERSTALIFPYIDATAEAYWASDFLIEFDEQTNTPVSVNFITLDSETADQITEKMRGLDDVEIFGVGANNRYTALLPDGSIDSGALITVDKENYEMMCEKAGVPIGSNILINLRREASDGKRTEYVPYDFSKLKNQMISFSLPGREPIELVVLGELTGQDVPFEISYVMDSKLAVIIPEGEALNYAWFANTRDASGFVEFSRQLLNDNAPRSQDAIIVSADCASVEDVMRQMNDLFNTIMLFVYGFVGMLTLIAVTSVISTISTNIRARAKEFAVLESIGMTKSGVKKMLNLESILCSARSLAFGIPIGVLSVYALYKGMGTSVSIPFELPLLLIGECILGVFAVTWITMRYVASRLKRESIIETIRADYTEGN